MFWGVLMAAVAAIMLSASGGDSTALDGLQRLTILVAAPWTIVMLIMAAALIKDLRRDPLVLRSAVADEVVSAAVVTGAREHHGEFEIVTSPLNGDSTESSTADADETKADPPK